MIATGPSGELITVQQVEPVHQEFRNSKQAADAHFGGRAGVQPRAAKPPRRVTSPPENGGTRVVGVTTAGYLTRSPRHWLSRPIDWPCRFETARYPRSDRLRVVCWCCGECQMRARWRPQRPNARPCHPAATYAGGRLLNAPSRSPNKVGNRPMSVCFTYLRCHDRCFVRLSFLVVIKFAHEG